MNTDNELLAERGGTLLVGPLRAMGQSLLAAIPGLIFILLTPITGPGVLATDVVLRTLGAALASQSRVTFYLVLMALLGMGLARYL